MNQMDGRFVARQIIGKRSYQEDDYGFDGPLFLLADGMGGQVRGDMASSTAIKSFMAAYPETTGPIPDRLRASLDAANDALAAAIAEQPELEGMGTTLVGVVISERGIDWISVGDSPLWLFRDGQLRRLNADHSMAAVFAEMVAAGRMTQEEADTDSNRHALRSAVMGDEIQIIDVASQPVALQKGDRLLLASDGLMTLEDAAIARILQTLQDQPLDRVVDALIEAVEAANNPQQDNTTVLLYDPQAAVGAMPKKPRAKRGKRLVGAVLGAALLGLLGYGLADETWREKLTGTAPEPPAEQTQAAEQQQEAEQAEATRQAEVERQRAAAAQQAEQAEAARRQAEVERQRAAAAQQAEQAAKQRAEAERQRQAAEERRRKEAVAAAAAKAQQAERERQQKAVEQQVANLLKAAAADIEAQRLTTPIGNNAWEKYLDVLEIKPGHAAAEVGQEQVKKTYMTLFDTALAEKKFSAAEEHLGNMRHAYPANASVLEELNQRLGEEQAKAEKIQRLAAENRQAEERRHQRRQPGHQFQDCDECPKMVTVPAGSFMMGSLKGDRDARSYEYPQHEVTIDQPFAVGIYEVTFAEWDACANAGGCKKYFPKDAGWSRGQRPVINVDWKNAQTYVEWLSAETGATYRLLSEAEWEYVARAGTTTRYHFGDEIEDGQANFNVASFNRKPKTTEVGSFAANGFGLHDVHGNVAEWVQDCWNADYKDAPTDGSAWEKKGDCNKRVRRGGAWRHESEHLRSAARFGRKDSDREKFLGFRVARDLEP